MSDNPLRLTKHDQVLINALMSLVLPVIVRGADQKMQLEIIARVLPHVNREHFYISPLADWSETLLAANSNRASEWHRATFEINSALARFTNWRLGLLLDDMRAEKAAASKRNAA